MSALLENLVDLAQLLVWGGLWTLGGWWLARGAFRLEEEEEGLYALVFDSVTWRGVAVFGRHTDAGITWFEFKPEFTTLVAIPDPVELRAGGFSYAYIDQTYWHSLSEADQALLESPCVKILKEVHEDGN